MSIKLVLKLSAVLVAFIVLILLYFRNVHKANKITKLGDRLENDWNFARKLADSTNQMITEIQCELSSLCLKLERLIYMIDIQDHRVIKCHKHTEGTFILITAYEHLNTSNPNSVEKIVQINYKFIIDRPNNKVVIYSDNGFNTNYDVRAVFIKGFFKKYIGIDID